MNRHIELPSPLRRIALFGGGGFIGVHLAKALTSRNDCQVHVLDVDRRKLDLYIPAAGCTFTPCDIQQDDALIDRAVAEADLVYNLIAFANPQVYLHHPLAVVQLNLFDNLKIINACARHHRRLFHFSTSEVYGKSNGDGSLFNEDHSDCVVGPIRNQRWIYSCAKQLLDRIVYAHGKAGDFDFTLVRPFNFIGPLIDYLPVAGDTKPRVFSQFMAALLEDRPLRLVDGGAARRCYTDIDDAIAALLLLLDHPERCRNEIFNIGNANAETSVADLAVLMQRLFTELTGRTHTAGIEHIHADRMYGEGYEDCARRLPDITKIRNLGWSPKHDLADTIRKTMRFHLENARHLTDLPNAMHRVHA